jgi:hypothetical protein
MMATGVPVAIAMAGSALVYILLTGDSRRSSSCTA